MSRGDPYSDDIDWLDVGSDGAPGGTAPPRRPWPRWFTAAVVLAVVALVLSVLNRERATQSTARVSTLPTTSPTSAPTTPAPSPTAPAFTVAPPAHTSTLPAVSVTRLGRPLLGATTGWELIARGDEVLVRIELAAGRITRTTVPGSRSDQGFVSLLAGADQVLIQPLDRAPGYLVPDGKPSRELPVLDKDGWVFPGPAPNQMWMRSGDSQPVMALTTLDGGKLAGSLPMPPDSAAYEVVADGAGGLLVSGVGGVYTAGPDGLRRISTGALLAVGPTGWLVAECDDRYRCQTVLIGRVDGSRQTVNAAIPIRSPRGVISPDGATAAMMTFDPSGRLGLELINLASGNRRALKVSLHMESYDGGGIAFSPDSALVFAVTADKTLAVINRETGTVGGLGVSLPELSQLVLRPAR
ncbi:MAG TPA: hypothetical protein VF557_20235 [Jatrophihabitans sp.]|uniref:hypothetical protein n=1 Tax=Jatrophihabitans sp. TaxID=1932789 RepID=UPI002EE864CC